MPKRDQRNYPPYKKGYSCHHVAYNYKDYQGELEHRRYQYNTALLISAPNARHNMGRMALHPLIDPVYGPPPKPRYMLMGDCVDFMESLDQEAPRLSRLGKVIDFYFDEAECEPSNETAQQAMDIATHYAMQKWILEEGGESFVREQQEQLRFAA
jgi:hypothetical protein